MTAARATLAQMTSWSALQSVPAMTTLQVLTHWLVWHLRETNGPYPFPLAGLFEPAVQAVPPVALSLSVGSQPKRTTAQQAAKKRKSADAD